MLTIAVGQRDDLSEEHLKELLAGSIDVVRRRLFDVVKPERQAAIKQAMSGIDSVHRPVENRRNFEPAQRAMLALHQAGGLERDDPARLCQGVSNTKNRSRRFRRCPA